MKTTLIQTIRKPWLIAAAAIAGLSSAQAAVSISSNVTFNSMSGLYHYTYGVTNSGALDIVLVSVPASSAASVAGIFAPIGYSLTYDPSQGWINLTEDNDIFTDNTFAPSSTVTPFEFTSPLQPVVVTFSAFDAGGNEFSGAVQSPIPEPSAALLAGLAALGCITRRRRQ
jgi:hypothetical protein